MSHSMRKTLALLLCVVFCLTLVPPAWAREVVEEERAALGRGGEGEPGSAESGEPDGYAILLEAIQNQETDVNLDGMGVIRIQNDLTIPAGMFVSAWGGSVIEVPEGVALSVDGKLHADGFILDGTLNVGENTFVNMGALHRLYNGHPLGMLNLGPKSSVDMRGEYYDGFVSEALDGRQLPDWIKHDNASGGRALVSYDAWDDDGLSWAYEQATSLAEPFVGRVYVNYDAEISGNLDPNRDGTELYVDGAWGSEGALTIAQGTAVSVGYTCIQNATLTVNGQLINNDRIELRAQKDGEGDTISKLPSIVVENGGELVGPGRFYVYGIENEADAKNCIQGLGELSSFREGDHWVFYSAESLFGALEAACNGVADYIDLSYLGELTIERSITIPQKLYVEAKGTILTVPNGVTVTVQGRVKTRAFNIQEGGTLILDGGWLELYGTHHDDFPVNGALVLENTTVDIPAPVWGEWCNNGQRNNVTFNGDNAVIRAMFEPAEDNIADTFDRANQTVGMFEHVEPVINVSSPIEIPENITVNQGVQLNAHEDITVPAGITLTLNNWISMRDDSRLIVYGTLANNAFLEFTHTENAANNPRLIIKTEEGGAYTGGGFLGPQEHDDPDAYFAGVDLSAYGRVMDNTGTRYMPSGIFYHDLKEACESENPPQNMKFKNLGTITIEDDLTIPAGMRVDAAGTTILVPDDVTLTVKGILIAGALTVNGSVVFNNAAYESGTETSAVYSPIDLSNGSITVNHPGELTVFYPASDPDSLVTAAQEAAAQTIANADNKVWVPSVIVVPEDKDIHLSGVDMIIEKNGVLNLNSSITADNARIIVKGRLENYGEISMRFDEGFYWPQLRVEGGVYAGDGSVIFYDDAPDHLYGVNMDAFNVTELTDPDRWVYSVNTGFAFERIQEMAAVAAEDLEQSEQPEFYELNLKDLGDVIISSSVTIPPNMYINAKRDRIIVPEGVAFILDGDMRTGGIKIEEGGAVTVNGNLDVDYAINGDGALTLNNTRVHLAPSGVGSLNWENITLNNADFQVTYYAKNDNEFISAMNEIQDAQWPRGVQPVLTAEYDVEAGGDLSVPEYMELDIAEKTLTLSEGATLTVDGRLRAKQDARIIINGRLVNNGNVDTVARENPEDTSPRLIFGPDGIYEGRGYLGVMDLDNPESYISNLDLDGFERLVDNIGVRYYQVGDVWGELQAAIDNGENYYYMGNLGELTMPSDVSLPANFNIETWGTTIIVPSGKTLTIAPGANIGIHNLVVDNGGSVVVAENGYLSTYTSLVLNGSMTADRNARLHLASQTNDTSFLNRITLNDVRGATIHFYPSDETELRTMLTASDAMQEPFIGNIHVRFPWTLSSAIAFDGKTDLEIEANNGFTGSLTISAGGELTLNRYTQVRSTDLTVKAGGRLINNAELVLEKNDRFEVGNLAVEEGGSYAGYGVIRVYDTSEEDAPAHITGIDGLVGLRTARDGEEVTEFRPDAFQDLKQAVVSGAETCDLKGVGYVRIAENFTIPQGMRVEAWNGTVIDVPEGVTLTINGEIFADGLILNGAIELGEGVYSDLGNLYDIENQNGRPRGTLSLAKDAELRLRQYDNNIGINPNFVSRWVSAEGENARLGIDYFDTWDENNIHRAVQDARNLPDTAYGNVILQNDQRLWNLDLTNPRDVALELSGHWDESEWHSNGVTLGNSRTQYIDVRGGELYIKGSFENTDRIELHKEQGADPQINFVDNPDIIGSLRIYVYDAESEEAARACVNGLDDLMCYQEGGAWVLTKDVFAQFKAACEDGETEFFDLTNLGELEIEESVTIPERMKVNTWGTVFIVPEGVAFGVERDGTGFDGFVLNGTVNVGNGVFASLGTMYDISDGRPGGELNVGSNASVDIQGFGYVGEERVLLDTTKLSDWVHKADFDGRILLSYDAWNDTDFAEAYSLAAAMTHPYVGRITVCYPMTLQENLSTSDPRVELFANKSEWGNQNGSITVPAGVTLSAADMSFGGGTLTVNGTLVNNDMIELRSDDKGAMATITVGEGGKLSGMYRIYVYGVESEEAARACVTGVDNLECRKDGDAWVLSSRSGAFEALKAACADESAEYIDLSELGRLRIEENITIPERLEIDAWGTVIEVPEGVTLTVNRGFHPDGFLLNGTLNVGDETDVGMGMLYGVENGRPAGTLNVGNHCLVDIEGMGYDPNDVLVYLDGAKLSQWAHKNGERGRILLCYYAVETGDFEEIYPIAAALPDPFVGRVHIYYDYTLTDNLNANEDAVELMLDDGGSLTIPAGKTLTARYMELRDSSLYVNGMLVNTDRIVLNPTDAGVPEITIGESGRLIGPGEIDVRAETLEEAGNWLIGFTNLTEGEWSDDEEAWVFYTNDDPFELLSLACEQKLTDYLDLRHQGDVTIRDITIPARLAVEAQKIIVPDGVTLTVEGYLKVNGLVIAPTGKVIIQNHAYLGIFDGNADRLVIDGSLELLDSWIELAGNYWLVGLDETELANISCQGNSGVRVVFNRVSGGVNAALEETPQAFIERIAVVINYDFTLSDDLTIPEGVVLEVNNRFTVPAGKTLTVDGTLNIRQNGVVDVFGTLVNNSFLEYKPDSAGDTGVRLILEDGAVYTGFGEIAVTLPAVPESSIGGLDLENDFDRFDDEIGSHFRLRPVIDLMLPAMLTEIESEAFAGGAFRSVYIPESVTEIAQDAFGDMQGLTVYGTTETASSFAKSRGYTFVEYSPAA